MFSILAAAIITACQSEWQGYKKEQSAKNQKQKRGRGANKNLTGPGKYERRCLCCRFLRVEVVIRVNQQEVLDISHANNLLVKTLSGSKFNLNKVSESVFILYCIF